MAMIIIPIVTPIIVSLGSPYSFATGNNSFKATYTIIPAQNAKDIPNKASLNTVLNIRNPINAPIGSARPERNEI